MSELNLDFTGNETMEELEAILEKAGDLIIDDGEGTTTDVVENAPVVDTKTDVVIEGKTEPVVEKKEGDTSALTPGAVTTELKNEPIADIPNGILSKDGKHVIPYAVLEAERNNKRRLDEAHQQAIREAADAKRQLEVLTRQINNAGLTPAKLPENSEIPAETMQNLRETFPEIANAIDLMSQKVEYLQRNAVQTPVVNDSVNPVIAAMNAVPELKEWQANDPDRFVLAGDIDDLLNKDPAWKDKPLTERFTEVARRTRAAYGEQTEKVINTEEPKPTAAEIQQQAAEKLAAAEAKPNVPASPSELGVGSTANQTELERMAGATYEQLIDQFSGMTEEQIERLLEQAG